MQAIVRLAEQQDLAGVLALYRELRPDDPVLSPNVERETFANLVARKDVDIVVCVAGKHPVATCMLATIPNLASGARPFAVIEHVVTLSSHRRKGYGRLVLEYALARAWSRDCYKVVLLSGFERKEAHRLYESVGFLGDIERGFVAKRASAE
jgi:GNAT superfamily N-acetyltransferase